MTERRNAEQVMSDALDQDIASMILDLGNPPLIERIFPNGWRSDSFQKRKEFHALCLRTYVDRDRKTEVK